MRVVRIVRNAITRTPHLVHHTRTAPACNGGTSAIDLQPLPYLPTHPTYLYLLPRELQSTRILTGCQSKICPKTIGMGTDGRLAVNPEDHVVQHGPELLVLTPNLADHPQGWLVALQVAVHTYHRTCSMYVSGCTPRFVSCSRKLVH